MNIGEYKNSLQEPLRKVTLCFLRKEDEVLLALKKVRFGKGKVTGFGGKVEKNEAVETALLREAKEELGIALKKIKQVAVLNFYFPYVRGCFTGKEENSKYSWDQQVIVFLCRQWEGDSKETEELLPRWYRIQQLPLGEMWSDARHWLPVVLSEKKIRAEFLFDSDFNVEDFTITKL